MSLTTIIFDLDGTLLYTLEDLTDSTNYALSKYCYPPRSIDEIKNFVGNGVELLIERALPNGKDNKHYKECLEDFKTHYSQNMFNKTKPYDGIIDVLKNLKNSGYKIAIISNKFDSAVKELSKQHFNGLIDAAQGQTDGLKIKPSYEPVVKILAELNSKPEECVLIGDSEVDIQTAENSGIPCISVAWGYKSIDFLYKNGASLIVFSPEELLELI